MKEAVKAARLVAVSFKTLRATYGKRLLKATNNIEMVAKALGHSDSRITRKHYAQLLPSELASGMALVPALGFKPDRKVKRFVGKTAKF
jgi:integrase